MSRYKPTGWRNEPYRHALAAKGVSTKNNYFSKFGDFVRGVTADAVGTSKRSQLRDAGLRSPERVKDLKKSEDLARTTVEQPQLTQEEELEVQRRMRVAGFGNIPESQAWRFWKPSMSIQPLRKEQMRQEKYDKDLDAIQSTQENIAKELQNLKKEIKQETVQENKKELIAEYGKQQKQSQILTNEEKTVSQRLRESKDKENTIRSILSKIVDQDQPVSSLSKNEQKLVGKHAQSSGKLDNVVEDEHKSSVRVGKDGEVVVETN